MAFFQEMKSYGLQPDSSAYGAALAIAVRAKKASRNVDMRVCSDLHVSAALQGPRLVSADD